MRTRTKLVELLREGDCVVGGVVERGGVREEIRASVVVGADGPHSTVAKLVKAATYKEYDTPRAGYWGYWPRPAWYAEDRRYRGAAIIQHRDDDYRLAFPAGTDQVLLGIRRRWPRSGPSRARRRRCDATTERCRRSAPRPARVRGDLRRSPPRRSV